MRGIGESTESLHPHVAEHRIRDGMREAMGGDLEACRLSLPDRFLLEVRFHQPALAYTKAFYPGCRQLDELTIAFETDDYFEVMRAVLFLI